MRLSSGTASFRPFSSSEPIKPQITSTKKGRHHVLPRTIDDLAPDQKVSGPVIAIDYDLLGGLPAEARDAILDAVAVLERLERLHARFSGEPAERDLFDRLTRHEVNAWAIEEDKPLIETS